MNRRKFLGLLPIAGVGMALPTAEAEEKVIERVVVEKEKLPIVDFSVPDYHWNDQASVRRAIATMYQDIIKAHSSLRTHRKVEIRSK